MVAQPSFFPTFVGGSDTVGGGLTDLAESGVIVCRLCDQRHIMRRRIMIFVRKPVRVGKMRVRTSQGSRFLIHQFHECIHTAADMFRHGNTHLIGGFKHHTVEAIFHGQIFSQPDTDIGTALFDAIDRICREGYFLGRTRVFNRDQCGKNLGDTGRILCDIHVFGIQESPTVEIHHHCGFCPYGRSLRPVGGIVGLDRFKVGIRLQAFRFCGFFGCFPVCGFHGISRSRIRSVRGSSRIDGVRHCRFFSGNLRCTSYGWKQTGKSQ